MRNNNNDDDDDDDDDYDDKEELSRPVMYQSSDDWLNNFSPQN